MVHVSRITAVIGADVSDFNQKMTQAERRIAKYAQNVRDAAVQVENLQKRVTNYTARKIAEEQKVAQLEEKAKQALARRAAAQEAIDNQKRKSKAREDELRIATEKAAVAVKALANAQVALLKTEQAINNAQGRISKLNREAEQSTEAHAAAVDKLDSRYQELETTITKKFQTALSKTGAKLHQLGSDFSIGVTLPITLMGKSIIDTGVNWERTLLKMDNLTELTSAEVVRWADKIKILAQETGQLPTDLANAMYFVASRNITGAKSFELLSAAAKAAAGGMGEVEKLTDLGATIMAAYGQEVTDITKVFDQLTVAIKLGAAEPDKYATNLGKIVGMAAQMKVPIENVLAVISSATNVGIPLETAAVGLRTLFSDVLRALGGAKNETVFKDLNIDLRDFVDLMSRDLPGALELFYSKAKLVNEAGVDITKNFVQAFPHARGFTLAISQTGANAETTAKMLKEMSKQFPELSTVFNNTADNLVNKIDKMNASFELMKIEIFESLKPVLASVIPVITDWLKWFNGLSDGTKRLITNIALLAAALGPSMLFASNIIRMLELVRDWRAAMNLLGLEMDALAGTGGTKGIGKFNLSLLGLVGRLSLVVGGLYALKEAAESANKAISQMPSSHFNEFANRGTERTNPIHKNSSDTNPYYYYANGQWKLRPQFMEQVPGKTFLDPPTYVPSKFGKDILRMYPPPESNPFMDSVVSISGMLPVSPGNKRSNNKNKSDKIVPTFNPIKSGTQLVPHIKETTKVFSDVLGLISNMVALSTVIGTKAALLNLNPFADRKEIEILNDVLDSYSNFIKEKTNSYTIEEKIAGMLGIQVENLKYLNESQIATLKGFYALDGAIKAIDLSGQAFRDLGNLLSSTLPNDTASSDIMSGSVSPIKERFKGLKDFLGEVAVGIGDIFSDLMYQIAENGFGRVFSYIYEGFKRMLFRMAVEYLQSQLVNLLFKGLDRAFGGGTSTTSVNPDGARSPSTSEPMSNSNALAVLSSKLFGTTNNTYYYGKTLGQTNVSSSTYSSGGFTPGTGNSEIVMPKINVPSSGGGCNVTFVYNINTPDAQSFRKSQSQLLNEAAIKMQKISRRYN